MMHAQALNQMMKQQVKDTYGRFIGHVIGFSLDNVGQMKGMGVELGAGYFKEYPNDRVIMDGESIVILPEWKDQVERLKKNSAVAQKRSEVLEELRSEGEVPQYVYEELKSTYDTEINDLRSSYDSITALLQSRVKELETRRIDVERFLGGLKVQFRAKEIDDETYKIASETMVEMMKKDEQERSEILFTLTWLTGNTETDQDSSQIEEDHGEPVTPTDATNESTDLKEEITEAAETDKTSPTA